MNSVLPLVAVLIAFGHSEAIAGPEISLRDDLVIPFLEQYGRSILLVSMLGGFVGYRIGRKKKHALAGAIKGLVLGAIGSTIIAYVLVSA